MYSVSGQRVSIGKVLASPAEVTASPPDRPPLISGFAGLPDDRHGRHLPRLKFRGPPRWSDV
jgi:hypothetical protein